MWYKIESQAVIIYMSDELIEINPDLATDLSAEILTSLIRFSYWDLLSVFQNNETNKVKKVLKAFKLEKRPSFIEKSG